VDAVKLPRGSSLLPLYEAIVNSIQSIQEAKIRNGKIDIHVERDIVPLGSEYWETDIHSFVIADNGVGFNDKHYESFNVYGTDCKLDIGCKGVGRVFWLKAFSDVFVESHYKNERNEMWKRKFRFLVSGEMSEVENHPVHNITETGAKVSLVNFSKKYMQNCHKKIDALARDIMNHCFAFLALDVCPVITISDGKEVRIVNDLFSEYTNKGKNMAVNEFEVRGAIFHLISTKSYAASSDKHMLHFCAHKREVYSENISKLIPELNGRLYDGNKPFTYSGFVTGGFFDDKINSERTNFTLSKESDEEQQVSANADITMIAIKTSTIPIVRKFLEKEIASYTLKNKDRIEGYVSQRNPRFRTLLSYCSECIASIPYTKDDNSLELELFKSEQAFRLQIKIEQSELLNNEFGSITNIEKYQDARELLAMKLSSLGKDALAEYIIHRKVMLDLLAKSLEYSDEAKKKYSLERNVHSLIFPLTTTSDDIDYKSHNLWIIDEKLAYHYYLASDKPISTYQIIKSDSRKEPDIAIFDPAFALTEDTDRSALNNITIIEFKRPGRTDLDCIDQVIDYIKLIRAGQSKDRYGQIFTEDNLDKMRFTCYIICDVNYDLIKRLSISSFHKAPDGFRYYSHYKLFNASIEIIPYSVLINDSIKRNKVFFDQLFKQKT
jgi:hypothetical protein